MKPKLPPLQSLRFALQFNFIFVKAKLLVILGRKSSSKSR